MRASILLPFIIASALAAPFPRVKQRAVEIQEQKGRLERSPATPAVQERIHHAGRLGRSRQDERAAHPLTHDIPDSGETWDLAEPYDMDVPAHPPNDDANADAGGRGRGLVFAGAKGLRGNITTKAWTDLVDARPEAPGDVGPRKKGQGDDEGRRSWSTGRYVGALKAGVPSDEDAWVRYEAEQWDEEGYELGDGEGGEDQYGDGASEIYSASWTPADGRKTHAKIRPERFRIAAKAAVPCGGWAVDSRGEWYLAQMD